MRSERVKEFEARDPRLHIPGPGDTAYERSRIGGSERLLHKPTESSYRSAVEQIQQTRHCIPFGICAVEQEYAAGLKIIGS